MWKAEIDISLGYPKGEKDEHQRDISGIKKVISLYARGMSTRYIHDQLLNIYGIELSAKLQIV